MNQKRVAVAGGGLGGITAAILLATRGIAVTLLEKNPHPGGKLNYWNVPHPQRTKEERPFQFDTGPSLLTLPLVVADLFSAAGCDARDYLQISRLNPVSRFIWPDGKQFSLPGRLENLSDAVQTMAPQDVNGVKNLLAHGKKVWDLSSDTFLNHAPEQLLAAGRGFSPLAAWKMLSVPIRIGALHKFQAMVDRQIKDQRLRDVFYQYATYSGSDPALSPATVAVIPYVEMEMGGWHVHNGMYSIAAALEAVARKVGVRILTGQAVTGISIEQENGKPRAAGVTLADGSQLEADAVVVNADVVWAYRNLIPPEHRPSYTDAKLDQLEPGGSGFVLMLGIEGTYPQLAHHTKFMPDDYAAEIQAVFRDKTLPADPCIYVCAPTRSDPSLAPDGCENLFILCSAPPLDGSIDWAVEGPKYRDRIIQKLETVYGLTDLSKRIVVERSITPADMASMYNANAGSIYGISGNGVKQAFLRPPNRDRDIRGLFFVGGATHPGGGIPLVTLSGKIVSELILSDWGMT